MVRYRSHMEIRYGHFAEFLEIFEELNRLIAARGWSTFTAFVPTVGKGNALVLEAEYPDLATFDRETTAFYGDAECMKVFRRGSELVVQGSNYDELLQPAPHLA